MRDWYLRCELFLRKCRIMPLEAVYQDSHSPAPSSAMASVLGAHSEGLGQLCLNWCHGSYISDMEAGLCHNLSVCPGHLSGAIRDRRVLQ